MIKDLQSILNIGKMRNLAREVVEEDNEKFRKKYKSKFKTAKDLKDYLLTNKV